LSQQPRRLLFNNQACPPGGRLAKVEDSDGHSASLSYDATGRLASVVAPNNETISFVYDAGGRLIEQRLNSGQRTTQSWFEDGNLKQKQNLFNSTVLSSHLYTLDQQGRRAGQTETIGGTTKTWSYGYDHLDRLTSASDGSAETYTYDIYGNRKTKTKSGTTTAYLYDAAHQLAEIRSGSDTGSLIGAAVHDADGHLTKLCEGGTVTKTSTDCTASGTGATTLALVWNALDHLNTATRTGANAIAESYSYDDQGRRISKTSGATTTSYLYDGDAIHAEWNGSIGGNPAAAYVHGANIDEPLLRLTGATSGPGATQAAYLQDGLGSVVGTANVSGTLTANQRFDAWGNKTASSGTIPQYGYTGREPDATGLTFYRARYYHPGIARFASRDPMGMADSVSPYAYVANSPTNLIDPSGLLAQLTGTPMNAAYWGMLADASFYTGTQTDVRGGGNGGTFTPGQQSLQNAGGSSTLDKVQFGLDLLGLTEPFGVAADLVNAGISYGRGDALGGSLSLGAAIPVIGAAATTGKLGSKAADVLQANKAAGAAFEGKVMGQLQQSGVVQQVTVKTQSGVKTRIDLMGRDANGNIVCTECKASVAAPLTRNQAAAFPEIQQSGAIVVGKGKPGFPGGTQIPPTTVDIIRP
jgi:RHS repeat-associated protein